MTPEDEYKRGYYNDFASKFDGYNIQERDEHYMALGALEGLTHYLGAESMLDVGSGTGRALLYMKKRCPSLRVHGIEPSDGMRARAVEKGIDLSQLTAGSGTKLPFDDNAFDVVTSFGVLHHIRDCQQAVREMMRVARVAVFISDGNNISQGNWFSRRFKLIMNRIGLWQAFYKLKTGGKGFWTSPHDGLGYSYSVHTHRPVLEVGCDRFHYICTKPAGTNLVTQCEHMAMLAIKKGMALQPD
jgi:ubiquinone/menaquinone biosynthesis C-methylase UbiE